ncbi:hypothetical protein C5S35_10115 [Candidatus Methanophagaceae archaeon]|nr:hypothetical protein C5S35_10115 [Methanophagales archaeon]
MGLYTFLKIDKSMEKIKEQRKKERECIAAYYDKRMRELLDPWYGDFQKWKRGVLSQDKLSDRIHEFHTGNQKLYSLFCQNREFLLKLIEWEYQNEVKE